MVAIIIIIIVIIILYQLSCCRCHRKQETDRRAKRVITGYAVIILYIVHLLVFIFVGYTSLKECESGIHFKCIELQVHIAI